MKDNICWNIDEKEIKNKQQLVENVRNKRYNKRIMWTLFQMENNPYG